MALANQNEREQREGLGNRTQMKTVCGLNRRLGNSVHAGEVWLAKRNEKKKKKVLDDFESTPRSSLSSLQGRRGIGARPL
jgi:hypothetical protein